MDYIVNIACGLANRMFQYSYFLFLKKQGFDVAVDFYRKGVLAHETVAWENTFPKALLPQASAWKIMLYGGGRNLVSRIRRRFLPWLTRVVEMPTAFDAFIPAGRGRYIIGVFQNARMVEAVKNEITELFEFPPIEGKRNQQLMQEMQTCNSVGIHVRKGKDYQQRIWYQNTCPVSFYEKAIAMMMKKLDSPRFYVFTDNPQWVKENFKGFKYTLVEGNPGSGWGCHFDMQLFSSCRHNIISNSTYSWWGAFLNKNQQKTVIVPRQWFNPESCEDSSSERLLCQNWLSI